MMWRASARTLNSITCASLLPLTPVSLPPPLTPPPKSRARSRPDPTPSPHCRLARQHVFVVASRDVLAVALRDSTFPPSPHAAAHPRSRPARLPPIPATPHLRTRRDARHWQPHGWPTATHQRQDHGAGPATPGGREREDKGGQRDGCRWGRERKDLRRRRNGRRPGGRRASAPTGCAQARERSSEESRERTATVIPAPVRSPARQQFRTAFEPPSIPAPEPSSYRDVGCLVGRTYQARTRS